MAKKDFSLKVRGNFFYQSPNRVLPYTLRITKLDGANVNKPFWNEKKQQVHKCIIGYMK